jgi:hypothetical protein
VVDIPVYQYNNVSTKVEFYLVPQHPIYQFSAIVVNLVKRRRGNKREEEEGTYPNIEFNIFICHCFDIEADCGDCSNRLIEFEFIQYRCGSALFLRSGEDVEERRGIGGGQIEEVGVM